jgi:hypothetical protein
MQESDLLVTLAEIAGVFVGFGALIAVRGGGPSDTAEVTMIRSVMSFGLWVIVAAFNPLVLGSYDISGHEPWMVSGIVAIVVFWGILIAGALAPENRAEVTRATRADYLLALTIFWPFVIVVTGALILVVLDLFPGQEPALYLTAVAAGVFAAAAMLLLLVFWQGRSRAAAPQ